MGKKLSLYASLLAAAALVGMADNNNLWTVDGKVVTTKRIDVADFATYIGNETELDIGKHLIFGEDGGTLTITVGSNQSYAKIAEMIKAELGDDYVVDDADNSGFVGTNGARTARLTKRDFERGLLLAAMKADDSIGNEHTIALADGIWTTFVHGLVNGDTGDEDVGDQLVVGAELAGVTDAQERVEV